MNKLKSGKNLFNALYDLFDIGALESEMDEVIRAVEKDNDWISVEDELPDENQTVWACNKDTGFVRLVCWVWDDGWVWAESNGLIESERGKIITECVIDQDYDFTHWKPLPDLP